MAYHRPTSPLSQLHIAPNLLDDERISAYLDVAHTAKDIPCSCAIVVISLVVASTTRSSAAFRDRSKCYDPFGSHSGLTQLFLHSDVLRLIIKHLVFLQQQMRVLALNRVHTAVNVDRADGIAILGQLV